MRTKIGKWKNGITRSLSKQSRDISHDRGDSRIVQENKLAFTSHNVRNVGSEATSNEQDCPFRDCPGWYKSTSDITKVTSEDIGRIDTYYDGLNVITA